MAKALGFAPGQQDAWSKQVDAWGRRRADDRSSDDHDIPAAGARRSPQQVEHFPRHLGIHSGGMVICDRPVIEVCPVEWAPHGGPHGAAVGQGRLRGRRAW